MEKLFSKDGFKVILKLVTIVNVFRIVSINSPYYCYCQYDFSLSTGMSGNGERENERKII